MITDHCESAPNLSAYHSPLLFEIADVAEAAGGSLDQIVKVNIFLTDLDDFATVDQVMGRFFSKPYPARSTGENDQF